MSMPNSPAGTRTLLPYLELQVVQVCYEGAEGLGHNKVGRHDSSLALTGGSV